MPTQVSVEPKAAPAATEEAVEPAKEAAEPTDQSPAPSQRPAAPAQAPTAPSRRLSPAALRPQTHRLARLVASATALAVAVTALGILFYVLDANTGNWLVSDLENAANWFASPFQNTFLVHSAKLGVALNWGIAIVVYAVLGRVLAHTIERLPERIVRAG